MHLQKYCLNIFLWVVLFAWRKYINKLTGYRETDLMPYIKQWYGSMHVEHGIGPYIPVDTQSRRWFDEEKEGSKSSGLIGGFRSVPLGKSVHCTCRGLG